MPTPEERARLKIDAALRDAGWSVQDTAQANIHGARGVVLRNFPLGLTHGFADCLLYVDGKAAGITSLPAGGREAFKAYLTWHDRPFRKTHSLEELGEACLALDPTLRPVVDPAVPLTEYAWRFRYPGEAESPTREEAEAALAVSRAACAAIRSRPPSVTHPD